MVYKSNLTINTCYLGNMRLAGVSNIGDPATDKYHIPGHKRVSHGFDVPKPLNADELIDLAKRLEVNVEFKRELICELCQEVSK